VQARGTEQQNVASITTKSVGGVGSSTESSDYKRQTELSSAPTADSPNNGMHGGHGQTARSVLFPPPHHFLEQVNGSATQ